MTGFLDIKSPNFLGGTNVHSLVIIGLLGYIIYKKYFLLGMFVCANPRLGSRAIRNVSPFSFIRKKGVQHPPLFDIKK